MPKDRRVAQPTTMPEGGGASSTDADLVFVIGAGLFLTCALPEGGRVVVGRDPDCEISVAHGEVSRRHVEVRGGRRPTVQDLGSRNGIRVDGKRVAGGAPVAIGPGQPVQVGPFTLLIAPAQAGGGLVAVDRPRAELVIEDPAPVGPDPVLQRVASSAVSVLIRGETGVGKEVLATALHRWSGRPGPLLSLNCAALGESLLESELFGHERGAFTGAVHAKPGLFEAAAGGTVFLDEVGELPAATQAKLLRALEARQVLRLGGVTPVDLDVRFIAATNRDLRADVVRGGFRRDLYFRLDGVTLVIKPLRERGGAIGPLALRLLAAASGRGGGAVPRLSPGVLTALQQHPWPGNVRELKAVLERALLLCDGDEIRVEHLVMQRLDDPADAGPDGVADAAAAADDDERARIIAALDACAGNQTRAAKMLGWSRSTLATKLVVHDIPRPRGR